jgi:hypothetical protein
MPLSFDERLDRAAHLVGLSRRFFDIWWLYQGSATRPGILGAKNHVPEFFRFDEHAHLVSLVTHLGSLYERRSDTINLEALITEADSNNLVPPDVIALAKASLASVSDLRPKIAILRSNLFSHRSASLPYDDVFKKAAITPFQIRDLTDAGRDIANHLLAARGMEGVIFTGTTTAHTSAMLRELKGRS